jgi:hypothetical protein
LQSNRYIPEQLAGFKLEAARRRRRVIAMAVVSAIPLLLLFIKDANGRTLLSQPQWFAAFVVFSAALAIVTIWNLRCPACGKLIRNGMAPVRARIAMLTFVSPEPPNPRVQRTRVARCARPGSPLTRHPLGGRNRRRARSPRARS